MMKKFRIDREPIFLEIGQITEILDEYEQVYNQRLELDVPYRAAISDLHGKIFLRDLPFAKYKTEIGDLVHYNIHLDEFTKFDKTELPAKSKITEIA